MARRRYHHRRKPANTVWQPMQIIKVYDNIPAGGDGTQSRILGSITPGVVHEGSTAVTPFENQVVLERVRGQMFHGIEPASTTETLMNLNMGMFRVPEIIAGKLADDDMPNLFRSGEGEDYPIFHSCICGNGSSSPTSNLDMIDSKAKRKFQVGDAAYLSLSWVHNSNETNLDLHIGLNLRFLWRLLT